MYKQRSQNHPGSFRSSRQLRRRLEVEEKRRRNACAPISSLPVEILSEIFLEIRDSTIAWDSQTPRTFGIPLDHKGSMLWITITYVCHQWREAALNMPQLWTHIILSPANLSWAKEMFLRSRDCPLTIVLDEQLELGEGIWIVSEVQGHLRRCHTLILWRLFNEHLHYLLSGANMGRLQCLLMARAPQPISDDPHVFGDYSIHAPFLRRLVVESCYIDWNSALLKCLTHLKLIDLPEESRLSCKKLAAFLSEMHSLQVLHLCGFLPTEVLEDSDDSDEPATGGRPAKPILLQQLQYLYLSCDLLDMSPFLASIELSPSCKIELGTWDPYDSDTLHLASRDIRNICFWLSEHFRSSRSASPLHHIQTLTLFDDVSTTFRVQGFERVDLEELVPTKGDPFFIFGFLHERTLREGTNMGQYGPQGALNSMILNSLPLNSLTILLVGSGPDRDTLELSESDWRNIFGSIPTLEIVFIHKVDSLQLIKALTPLADTPRSDIPFPALIRLTILHDNLDYQALVKSLRTRLEHGAPQLVNLYLWDYIRHCPSEAASRLLTQLQEVPQPVVIDSDSDQLNS